MSITHMGKPKAIPVVLRRHSEYYRPFFLGDRELTDLHFFGAEGPRYSTGHGWFDVGESADEIMELDLGVIARLRRKADWTSQEAFFLHARPRADSPASMRDRRDLRGKIELFLPVGRFEWEHLPGHQIHQLTDRQVLHDVHLLKRFGVGVTTPGGELPITEKEATDLALQKRLPTLDPALATITSTYTTRLRDYEEERDRLDREIEERQKRRASLEAPDWKDEIVKPLAERLLQEPELRGLTCEVSGPFGMVSRVPVFLHEADQKIRYALTFEPGDLDRGEVFLRDTRTDTHRFAAGSIGERNGMNHPKIPFRSLRELVQYLLAEETTT